MTGRAPAMPFSTLQTLIDNALKQSPFSISGAALSSPAVSALLAAQFGSDALVLIGASKVSETATAITVKGTLAASYLGATGLQATATFDVSGAPAALSMVVDQFGSDWSLATAYPALAGTMFDQFSYAEPIFTLTSAGAPALPASFPSQYGMPAYPPAVASALSAGLGFQATATVKTGFDAFGKLLGGDSWQVSGPVETLAGLPSIALASATGSPLTLGPFSVGFSFSLVSALLVPPDGSAAKSVTTLVQFEADIEKPLSSGATMKIPVRLQAFSPWLDMVIIRGGLDGSTPITLADIGELIGADITKSIPATFPIDAIGVRGVSLTVTPATMALVSIGIEVGIQPKSTEKTWSVFDGLVVFDGMNIDFSYMPALKAASIGIDATATIAGGALDAGIALPETTFHCTLAANSTLDIAAIVKKVSGGSIGMPQVSCTALNFMGSVKQNYYRFQATVDDNWSITIPGANTSLAITEVGMDLTYAPGATDPLTGQVIGTFVVGQVSLYASAEYDGASQGWTFTGGTQGDATIDVTQVVTDALDKFGVSVSGNAPKVTLGNLNISFNSATHDLNLSGIAKVTIAGTECDLGIQIARSTTTGTDGKPVTDIVFNGYLWIGSETFELDFTVGSDALVAGKWIQGDESTSPLSLDNLMDALGLPGIDLPSSLDLVLTGAALVYDITNEVLLVLGDTAGGSSLLLIVTGKAPLQVGFAARSGASMNLSDLPLVGQRLQQVATLSIDGFQVSVSNQPLATAGAAFNKLLETYQPYLDGLSYPTFPIPATPATKAFLGATLHYGAGTLPLALPLDGGASAAKALPAPRAQAAGAVAPASPAGGAATSSSTSDGTLWFNVQRSFGPVTIQRIGASYQSSAQALWLQLDASLSFGPLTLNLEGLDLGSPISTFSPEFSLSGLGISYAEPPLTVAGSLVNLAPKGASYLEFEGSLTIGTADFTVTTFGYYGNKSGFPSMFVFGDIAYDFGGPPAFFVTGLALGFGYNSALTLPTIDQVAAFPFIEVLPTSAVPSTGVFGGGNPAPLTVLDKLLAPSPPPAWVATSKGALWFGAGITFTSFEMVNSQALVTVQAGQDLVIALLGTSRAQFPQPAAGATGGPTYAYVELDLEAVLAPAEGLFSVQAVLASTSFLLDRACVLSGGFAFFVWFGPNAHAGDFVLTLGGYNAAFTPPAHYPAVPRVGFHWSLDSSITIQGGAYFALTPSVLMFGGALDATYQSGNLKAWFDANTDVIIQWKPFWLYADIGITIGASYKIDLALTTMTVSVELGCDLVIHGPPTGGSVTVDWYIISFTIPFGDQDSSPPGAAGWGDVEAMLPSNGTGKANPVSISPTAGLHSPATAPQQSKARAAARTDADAAAPWTVRGGTFAFTTGSTVPATQASAGTAHSFQGQRFNVAPLAADPAWQQVSAEHAVTIQALDSAGKLSGDFSGAFSASPVLANVPSSLWGTGKAGAPHLVPDQIVGMVLTANPPQVGCSAGPVDVALSLADLRLEAQGNLPLLAPKIPPGVAPAWAAGTMAKIGGTDGPGIGDQSTAAARNAILAALMGVGYAPATRNDDMTIFQASAGCTFADIPLVAA